MKRHRLLACFLAGVMAVSMTACNQQGDTKEPQSEGTESSVEEVKTFAYDTAASITFEDGKTGFLGSDFSINPAAKETVFESVSRDGQKAVKITSADAGKLYVGIQMDALLGDRIGEVKTVEFTLESECRDKGNFVATSGKIYSYLGEDNQRSEKPWSIYLEKGNPKTVSYELPAKAVEGNTLVLSLEVNDGNSFLADRQTALYLYSISFKDAAGKVLAADSSAEFVIPEVTETDRSNLFALSDVVEFEGFACSGDAWAQNGAEMPESIVNALVPGSVIEVEYASEDGEMWIVMPWAEAGWMRVAQNDAYLNNSRNVAQVTYEQIEALCGEDKSTWGTMLQCESSSKWEVYSLKVGKKAGELAFLPGVEFEGFACSGDAWAQNGFEMSEDILNALVPGSVIRLQYTSEDGNLWVVVPWAEAGWMRVGQAGTDDAAVCTNGYCYVTYEQIEALCGEDKSTWGVMLQAEGSSKWEVYSVNIGTAAVAGVPKLHGLKALDDFACKAGAWAQNGFEIDMEALQPGDVIRAQYTSADGTLWAVVPWATAGWMRVGQAGTDDEAVCADGYCYVTYEQIEALCGEDKSTWGAMLQFESSSDWEVYGVEIGKQ